MINPWNRRRIFLFGMIAAIIFAACSKDHTQEPAISNTPTMLGKWVLDSITVKEYSGGALTYENTMAATGVNSTTYDFQANGNVQLITAFATLSYPYTINGSNISFDSRQYEIRNLAITTVTLFVRKDYPTLYDEQYLKLKR